SKSGVCEKCGQPFKVNRGRFGKFLSCTGYPVCENIKKLDKEGNIIIETEKKEKKATTKKKAPVKKKTVTKSKKKV
ncbi:MAG: topoisomerase DNA-binding C4 zinc finger domain-containing protein, partial [Fusobacteriaceae bacterium]